ncbi:MAG: helix-turn-helix transcriptional regulator [Clostridia bacterium]|nr:helix-turn-helix transcriptional regulator [Clostridia bacterium]
MKKARNYYSKIFLGYMSVLITLCIIIGAVVAYQMYTDKKNHDAMVRTYFENNYRETESKIQMFENISKVMFENEEVRYFADNSSDNLYYNYLRVCKDMDSYLDILTNLGATINLTDLKSICISPTGTRSLDDFFDSIFLNNEDIAVVKNMQTDSKLFIGDNSIYFTFVFKHQYLSGNVIYSFISIDSNFLLPISDDRTLFLLADKSFDISNDSPKLSNALSSLDANEKWYNISDKNLYIRSSQYLDDAIYFYEGLNNSNIYSFILFAILWAMLLLSCKKIAAWLADKMYTPINRIIDIFGYVEHSDDIEFLDKSIKKLIYNNQMLATQLNESKASIRNGFIVDLLYGVVSEDTAEQYIDEYKLSYLDTKCLCITFECDYNELKSNINEYNNTHLIQSNYIETLKKALNESHKGEFITIDKSKFVFISSETSKSVLKNKLLSILELSEEFYKIHPFIAIGRTVDSVKEINISFNDTAKILTRKFNYIEKSITFFDDLRTESNLFYYPIEIENALIENILYGDEEQVDKIVSELLNINLYELSLDKDNITEFKFAITATIKRIVKMMNKSVTEVFGENNIIYLDISHATTGEELANNIRDIIHKLCKFKSDSLNLKQRKITSDIMKYIEENYNRDISLTDISEYFCISAGHISRIFKRDIGIGFKEHLDNIRIEEAKKLLSTTSITINRIAEKIGYNHARSFIRTFKNRTGYSPKEYREKNM